jgi:hypothetical protein
MSRKTACVPGGHVIVGSGGSHVIFRAASGPGPADRRTSLAERKDSSHKARQSAVVKQALARNIQIPRSKYQRES